METSTPSIVLAVRDTADLQDLERRLASRFTVVGNAGNGGDAIRMVGEFRPDLVFMDVDLPLMGGIPACESITTLFPGTLVVLASQGADYPLAQRALRAGARGLMDSWGAREELPETLASLWKQEWYRSHVADRAPPSLGGGIWSFCGGTGGDGRTTLLLSVAYELLAAERRVAVVDLDLLFGDVAFYLAIPAAPPDLSTLLAAERYLEPAVLASHLRTHRSGLHVLPAPFDPECGAGIDANVVGGVLEALRRLYDYVLVDFPQGLEEGHLPLLAMSRLVFAVGSAHPNSLKDLEVLLHTLRSSAVEEDRLLAVLSSVEKPAALAGFRKRVPQVVHVLPRSGAACDQSLQAGDPVTCAVPLDPYSREVRILLEAVLQRIRTNNLKSHLAKETADREVVPALRTDADAEAQAGARSDEAEPGLVEPDPEPRQRPPRNRGKEGLPGPVPDPPDPARDTEP